MLLDSHSLIYRAYFALMTTPLSTSKGQLVNAVFGFWSIVLRGFQDVKPDYVIACFDLGRTFRHESFAEYKATRRPTPDDLREQFPIVRELLAAFCIPVYELQGFEADDLIGTLTLQAEAQGIASTIVSGDLDMLQLASDHVSLMTTRSGVAATVIYDPAQIYERYGLTPGQMIDFKALKGDTTDNIPGIPGVGDKTAAKLLQDFGTLDQAYARIDEVLPEKLRVKLQDAHDQVMISRQLVTIRRDVPVTIDLEAARLGQYDRAEVLRLFREYEFRSLVERIPQLDGEAPVAPGELLREADRLGPIPAAQVPGRESARSRPRPTRRRASAEPTSQPTQRRRRSSCSLDFSAMATDRAASRGRCRRRARDRRADRSPATPDEVSSGPRPPSARPSSGRGDRPARPAGRRPARPGRGRGVRRR